MPKFNPSAAKLVAVEKYFADHRPITAYSIKDLEKTLPAATGISGMQVKDYLTALTDENKIRVEKIGSGNWYWMFKGEEKQKKATETRDLNQEIDGLEGKIKDLKSEVERENSERNNGVGNNDGNDERDTLTQEINNLAEEKKNLEEELATYAENDPAQILQLMELVSLMKIAANMYTDNLYAVEQFLKQSGMGTDEINEFKSSLRIPIELEDIPE